MNIFAVRKCFKSDCHQVLKRAVRVEIEDTGISLVLGINDLNIQGFASSIAYYNRSVLTVNVIKIADKVNLKFSLLMSTSMKLRHSLLKVNSVK